MRALSNRVIEERAGLASSVIEPRRRAQRTVRCRESRYLAERVHADTRAPFQTSSLDRLLLRKDGAALDRLGVDRGHHAIWYWKEAATKDQSDSPTAAQSADRG